MGFVESGLRLWKRPLARRSLVPLPSLLVRLRMRQQIPPQPPRIPVRSKPRTRDRVLIEVLDAQVLWRMLVGRSGVRGRSVVGGLLSPVQLDGDRDGEVAVEDAGAGSGGGHAEAGGDEEEGEEGEGEGEGEEDVEFEAVGGRHGGWMRSVRSTRTRERNDLRLLPGGGGGWKNLPKAPNVKVLKRSHVESADAIGASPRSSSLRDPGDKHHCRSIVCAMSAVRYSGPLIESRI